MNRKVLKHSILCLLMAVAALPSGHVAAQSGLYVPSAKPIKDMAQALTNPETFCLLISYGPNSSAYPVDALDLLDSAYGIAFDAKNPMLYTMTIEGYGGGDTMLTKRRMDDVYRYFAQRSRTPFPIRYAVNRIHCSCSGDTVETLRFEVPTAMAAYDIAELPASRRMLNGGVSLDNGVLVTFTNNPDECVGAARGCFVPAQDSVVHGYYASLMLTKGSVYAVEGTKDTCPGSLKITIEDHLNYRNIVDRYNLVPHRSQIIVQAGYVVLGSNWAGRFDTCSVARGDSIYIRVPVTQEQVDAKLKFFGKKRTSRGMEYRALPTRKVKGKGELMLQAPINITMFDTIYLGKKISAKELGDYFYGVDSPTEAASFAVGGDFYVAFRPDKNGGYKLKKELRKLFRIIPDQEDETPAAKSGAGNPEEIIED